MESAVVPTKISRVRAQRFEPKRELIVSSKTLGTTVVYDLSTDNISLSGMLLSWNSEIPIPFIDSTILEMTIDPAGHYLKKPVSCLGKIVRTRKNESVSFGVRIVQMDESDSGHWEQCIMDLAKNSTPMLTDDKETRKYLKVG